MAEQTAVDVLEAKLADLREAERSLRQRLDMVAHELAAVREQMDALVRTLELIAPGWGKTSAFVGGLEEQRFRAMTIPEIAKELAREEGGTIKTAALARLLVQVGRVDAYRNAYATAFSALARSPEFRKQRKGEFVLRTAESRPIP
mgnify:CR=1 FL=1